MEIKLVYKVVCANMESALSRLLPAKYKIKYKVHEWVVPIEGTQIFAFTCKSQALEWQAGLFQLGYATNLRHKKINTYVYEGFAKVSAPKVEKIVWDDWSPLKAHFMDLAWKQRAYSSMDSARILQGTVLCDEIYLTRRIKQ